MDLANKSLDRIRSDLERIVEEREGRPGGVVSRGKAPFAQAPVSLWPVPALSPRRVRR